MELKSFAIALLISLMMAISISFLMAISISFVTGKCWPSERSANICQPWASLSSVGPSLYLQQLDETVHTHLMTLFGSSLTGVLLMH